LSILDRAPLAELTHQQVRAASTLRKKLIRLPGARLITGRADRGARIEQSVAQLADGTVLPVRIYRPRSSSASTAAAG
jgi:hypothetical protein